MTTTHHVNPLTGKLSAVTHTDVTLHVYDDGSIDIDLGDVMFRLNKAVTPAQLAEFHQALFQQKDPVVSMDADDFNCVSSRHHY